MPNDMSQDVNAAGTEGFLLHIRQLGASLLEHVALRLELLSLEAQEEKSRLAKLAICAALVSALAIVSLVMAGVVVLAIYWDTPNRINATLGIAAFFVLLTIAGGAVLSSQLSRSSTLFANSAREFRRDAAALTEG